MASVVDICNLALAHLGDDATVSSIDPPEGSVQADHCARFYPMALNSLLEMHTWGFATRRVVMAQLTSSESSEWDYAYAIPSNALNLIEVLPPGATDDYSAATLAPDTPFYSVPQSQQPPQSGIEYTPRPFQAECLSDGTQAILTDQANAVLRYTVDDVDPSKFSPLFVEALSWLLASHLAGPVIKGNEGMQVSSACRQKFDEVKSKAVSSDARQRYIKPVQRVPWMAGR